ncbi:MAG: FtsX-like permease family protein [Herbinix sp.]|nr:FtsX-like permease family protein [Herbinix sp.]
MKNNNKEIIRKLSKNSLKNNRMRNIFAIIAIILTSLLFSSLISLGSGMIQVAEEQTMRQVGTRAHGGFKAVTEAEYEALVDNPLVKDYGYDISVGVAKNERLAKRRTEIRYIQAHNLKFGFTKIKEGKLPEKENEIVLDTIVLDLLQIHYKVGNKVNIQFDFLDKEYDEEFILSGWYTGDSVMGASTAYVSETLVDKLKEGYTDEELREINKEFSGQQNAGLYQVNIMFKNSRNIEKNMMQLMEDSGLDLDMTHVGINWAYFSERTSEIDITSTVMLVVVFLVIMLTGFLIIYNIFHISILNDIRFYGLLKTIGTTKKQIKSLVIKQVMLLSIIGIPIGLLLGFLATKVLMPTLLGTMSGLNTIEFQMRANPFIFIFGGIFSLLTVLVSCRKPSKLAGSVSPVEAVKYSEDSKMKEKNKKTTGGAKIYRMALTNLARSKKKTAIVILSLSLSIVLLTEVVTLVRSFSIDEYLENMLMGDAMIFSNSMVDYGQDMLLSEEFYQSVIRQDGLENASKLYHSINHIDHTLSERGYEEFRRLYEEGKLDIREHNVGEVEANYAFNRPISEQRYAYDEELLENMAVLEGTFDIERFRTGNYVLVTPVLGVSDSYYHPGNIIGLNYTDSNPQYEVVKDSEGNITSYVVIYTDKKEYEVMAVVDIPYSMTEKRFALNGLTTILPKEELLERDGMAELFAASIQIEDDKETGFMEYLEEYTTRIDPNMAYQTKESLRDEFGGMTSTITIIGVTLAFVIAIVGVLNFVNTMLTSVITRKKEFAMLQSIGLTDRQLRKLLLYEGMYYIMFTAVISIIVGSVLSLTVVKAFNNIAAWFEYQYTSLPFVASLPIFILIALGVPVIAYRYLKSQSIVERLRDE